MRPRRPSIRPGRCSPRPSESRPSPTWPAAAASARSVEVQPSPPPIRLVSRNGLTLGLAVAKGRLPRLLPACFRVIRRLMDVADLKSAELVDAMGRLHRHRCHILDLVSPTPGRVLFGPAVTISYYPSCSVGLNPELYNFGNLFWEAVGDDPSGKVIVLASNGYTDTSMGGGTKLLRLQENGCAGVLTDARLRDFDQLAGYDFTCYWSGEATRWGGDQVTPFLANVPVVVAKVAVFPGQYVFADSSGAVLIPDDQVEEVLEGARRVKAEDTEFAEQISRERPGK